MHEKKKKNYKQNEDGHTAPGVRGHGSAGLPLSHSGNVVRVGLQKTIASNTIQGRTTVHSSVSLKRAVLLMFFVPLFIDRTLFSFLHG